MMSNTLECVICLNKVKNFQKVWRCNYCHNMNHLKCIYELLNSGNCKKEGSNCHFRCPNCNLNIISTSKPKYTCYCKAITNPEYNDFSIPHSCDQPCTILRECGHHCPLLCHPGPCPPCNVSVEKSCYCGTKVLHSHCGNHNTNTNYAGGKANKDTGGKLEHSECAVEGSITKGRKDKNSCNQVCNRPLHNCNGYEDADGELQQHTCGKLCHPGKCDECVVQVQQQCICQIKSRTVKCSQLSLFKCDTVCLFKYNCNKHTCEIACCIIDHKDKRNQVCVQDTSIAMCKCGKTKIAPLDTLRTSCEDELDGCDKVCATTLACGHKCFLPCHPLSKECFCDQTVNVKCKCEDITMTIKCTEIKHYLDFKCDEPCNTLMSCGVHQCTSPCCPLKPFGSKAYNLNLNLSHLCHQTCTKLLPCNHECGDMCHKGKCNECKRIISNTRLYCACQECFIEPPIYCGTSLPRCTKRCLKLMACGHNCNRLCHPGECTNCQVEVDTHCACGVGVVLVKCADSTTKNRCDTLCNKDMPCGHKCTAKCHPHHTDQRKCTSKCLNQRNDSCGHLCGKVCHHGVGEDKDKCSDTKCIVYCGVFCKCGNIGKYSKCNQESMLISNPDLTIDGYATHLECDDSCKVKERDELLNKSMGLNINTVSNPQLNEAGEQQSQALLAYFVGEKYEILSTVDSYLEMLKSGKIRTVISDQWRTPNLIEMLQNQVNVYWKLRFFSINQCIQFKQSENMIKPIISLTQFIKMNKNGFSFEIQQRLLNKDALQKAEIDYKTTDALATVIINNLTPQDREEDLKEKLTPKNLDRRFRIEWVNNFTCQLHFKFVVEAELACQVLKDSKGSFNCCKLRILKEPLRPEERLQDYI